MDRSQALHTFWASFGLMAIDEISAYDENLSLPEKYISYEAAVGEIDDKIPLTASLWHRSTSWEVITQMADQIDRTIGRGGVKIPYEGGQLWITRGSPIYRRGPVESSFDYRRITININAEYLTA